MTLEERIQKLEAEVTRLSQFAKQLQSSATIPLTVDKAFRKRLQVETESVVELQVPTDTSNMTRSVNESGSGTYDVMNVPDEVGIIELQDGTEMSFPLYNLP